MAELDMSWITERQYVECEEYVESRDFGSFDI